jgi:hypothetical protein
VGKGWYAGQEGLKISIECRSVNFGEPHDRPRIEVGAEIDGRMIATYDAKATPRNKCFNLGLRDDAA